MIRASHIHRNLTHKFVLNHQENISGFIGGEKWDSWIQIGHDQISTSIGVERALQSDLETYGSSACVGSRADLVFCMNDFKSRLGKLEAADSGP